MRLLDCLGRLPCPCLRALPPASLVPAWLPARLPCRLPRPLPHRLSFPHVRPPTSSLAVPVYPHAYASVTCPPAFSCLTLCLPNFSQVVNAEKKIKVQRYTDLILTSVDQSHTSRRSSLLPQLKRELNPTPAGGEGGDADGTDATASAAVAHMVVSSLELLDTAPMASDEAIAQLFKTPHVNVAGYCARKAIAGNDCVACTAAFAIPSKEVNAMPKESLGYFGRINRGGLVCPTRELLLAVAYCFAVFEHILAFVDGTAMTGTAENTSDIVLSAQDAEQIERFFAKGNQRYELQKIYEHAVFSRAQVHGPLLTAECPSCGGDRSELLKCALARLVNISLNNYTRRVTQKLAHEAAQKKEAAAERAKLAPGARKQQTLQSSGLQGEQLSLRDAPARPHTRRPRGQSRTQPSAPMESRQTVS